MAKRHKKTHKTKHKKIVERKQVTKRHISKNQNNVWKFLSKAPELRVMGMITELRKRKSFSEKQSNYNKTKGRQKYLCQVVSVTFPISKFVSYISAQSKQLEAFNGVREKNPWEETEQGT